MKKLSVVFLLILVFSFSSFAEGEETKVEEAIENTKAKTDLVIDKVQETIPDINSFSLLKRINPAPAKDNRDIFFDTTLNYPGFSRVGMGFGNFYDGFQIDLGLNALVSVILKNNFGFSSNVKISVGTGEFAFMLGGSIILRQKDNTVLIIDAGPSFVLSQNYFQVGLDVIASYDYFLTSHWYLKAGGEVNMVFFDNVTKGGFSFGFILPSIGVGYKF
ncbi:MAG: hypothetical protein WC162_08180 [Sphaerochaetaceae bacterium]|nr:hypothetical protein [Sphaerochaetaceae bacterium]